MSPPTTKPTTSETRSEVPASAKIPWTTKAV